MFNQNKNTTNAKNSKDKITITLVTFAILLLLITIVINLKPITAFTSMIMDIIAPIVIGCAIAYLLNPILKFLEFALLKIFRKKILTRIVAAIITYVYAILFITLLFSVVAPRIIVSLTDIISNYSKHIETAISWVNKTLINLMDNFEGFDEQHAKDVVTNLFTESSDIVQTVGTYLLSYVMTLIVSLKNLFLGLFISVYILMSKERLYAQASKCARAFMSDKIYNNSLRYIRKTNATFGRFFIGKLFDSAIIFAATLVLLLALKVPYPILIAMIVGVINIVPFFGLIVGIIVSSFIVLISAPNTVIIYLVVMIIIQQLDANVIAPKILGNSAGISSLGVIIAVTIMGAYFGIVGLIIGVPVFAILISIVKEFLEKRLEAKNLPVQTQEYYTDPDYSSESEDHKPIFRMLCEPLMISISKKVNSTLSNKLTSDEYTEDENTNSDNEEKSLTEEKETEFPENSNSEEK